MQVCTGQGSKAQWGYGSGMVAGGAIIYWAATLCWELSCICLTWSSYISRVLWAKKDPGERGTNRKGTGSKNKHRGRADLKLDDPGVQRHSLLVSLLCYPQTQLHSEGASYGHTTAAKIHVSPWLWPVGEAGFLGFSSKSKKASYHNPLENLFSVSLAQLSLDLSIPEPITARNLGFSCWFRLISIGTYIPRGGTDNCLRTDSHRMLSLIFARLLLIYGCRS